jgi:SAM-dependent methyltransferase
MDGKRAMWLKRSYEWLTKPRYGLSHVVLFGALLTAFGWWYCAAYRNYVMLTVAFKSSLPAIEVAKEATVPDSVAYRRQYDFTSDWFVHNIPIWQKVLSRHQGKPDVRYLEVGSYEGRSAVWMLENVLTDPTSRLTSIDLFDGPFEARYRANISKTGAAERVATLKGFSQVITRGLPLGSFDIIYIDGSHSKDDVLEDAVLCWRLLKPDGILIFDDYRHFGTYYSEPSFPKIAIDSFCNCFERQLTVIHNGYQLIVTKKPT